MSAFFWRRLERVLFALSWLIFVGLSGYLTLAVWMRHDWGWAVVNTLLLGGALLSMLLTYLRRERRQV